MLSRKQVKESSNEDLRSYIKNTVKPNIRIWQDERERIDTVVRNREMRARKEEEANN